MVGKITEEQVKASKHNLTLLILYLHIPMAKENLYDELKVNMTAVYVAYCWPRHCEATGHRT